MSKEETPLENREKPKENEYQEKPGGLFKVGNPGGTGRPKGSKSLMPLIEEALDSIPEGNKENKTYRQLLVIKILHKAIVQGSDSMIKELLDRIDGKAPIIGEFEINTPPAAEGLPKDEILKIINDFYDRNTNKNGAGDKGANRDNGEQH